MRPFDEQLTNPTTAEALFPHLQIGDKAPCLFILLLGRWIDPDEAVVAKDHRGAAGQIMEVSLLAFHEGGRDLNEHTLAKLKRRA